MPISTYQLQAETQAAQERARQRRAATRRSVGQHVAEALRNYSTRVQDLERLRDLGAEPPADLLHLVDTAEAINPLAAAAADQAAATPAPPDPADIYRQLRDGTDTTTVLRDVQRALTKASVTPAAETLWDSVLVLAQAAAARAITAARPGALIQALQPVHAALCHEAGALVQHQPSIVDLDDSHALRSTRTVRDAYVDSRELLARIGTIEAFAEELRGGDRYARPADFWTELPEDIEKRFNHARVSQINMAHGSWPETAKKAPGFLECLAAGARRLLPTRAELKAVIDDRGHN
ncbi:hypothetical protein [Streptomyces sp. UG1]|uniref:hypothetical protein n=1 Tax=Streptomyces sp. UG1 TaxID=3417652 RepID=UPI003CEAF26D